MGGTNRFSSSLIREKKRIRTILILTNSIGVPTLTNESLQETPFHVTKALQPCYKALQNGTNRYERYKALQETLGHT